MSGFRFVRQWLALLPVLLLAWPGGGVLAAPGALVGTTPLSNGGVGVSVAVDCDGNIYYTNGTSTGYDILYVTDKTGVLKSQIHTVDANGNTPIEMDEMAWDPSRHLLWATARPSGSSSAVRVFLLDPATGIATYQFTGPAPSSSAGCCLDDGIAYDISDGTLWLSPDGAYDVFHYTTAGVLIGSFTPHPQGNPTGHFLAIAGIELGANNTMYVLERPALNVQVVDKTSGLWQSKLYGPLSLPEGFETDAVSYASSGREVLWVRENANLTAIEILKDAPKCPTLCDTCSTPVKVDSTRYGRLDYFNTSDGSEPAVPLAGLATLFPSPRQFDDVSCDHYFAHTMLFPSNTGCAFIGGTLRLSLKSCGNTLGNDAIYLAHNGTIFWGTSIASLAPGGHWDGPDSMTLVLDLCHLPPTATYGTTAIPVLGIPYGTGLGSMDVYIQDDTGVDYMELTTYRCCYGDIEGRKFYDVNRNGSNNAEPQLANWTINLTGFAPGYGAVSRTTTTNTNPFPLSNYRFTGLPASTTLNISETNQPGWVNTGPAFRAVSLPSGGTVTNVDVGNWQCLDTRPDTCVAPPRCLVGWWPFDEATGTTCRDLAGGHTGTFVGAPTRAAGQFGSALCFPGGANYVNVPNTPLLNFGTGSFTMDAWIKTSMPAGGVQNFLDKRTKVGQDYTGYAMYLYQGKFGIEVAAGAFPLYQNYVAGPLLNDGNWHFVAATVCRTPGTPGVVKMYVDCVLVATYTVSVPTGSVTNTADLWIGQRNVDGQADFVGCVDELELMNCCVDSLALARICHTAPKCQENCYISHVNPWWWGGYAYPYLTVCNNSATVQCYHWSVAACSANGLSFSPSSGTVCVAAHSCQSIYLNAIIPVMSAGQSLCFTTTVLNDRTGHCFQCNGTVTRPRWWWGSNGPVQAVAIGQVQNFTFQLYNTDSQATHVIHTRIAAHSTDDDPTNQVVRLNGLPPGTPVEATYSIAPMDSVPITFTASMDDFQPFTIQDIVLSGDLDGDGVYEEICGQPIVTMATFDEPVGVSPSSARPFDRVTASPNPFFRTTAVQFSLPVASEVKVNVYDVLGRQVRTLQSGKLPAGEHRILWDGRDANGTSRGGGIYFVRVQVGDQIISTKVVQMR